MCKIKTISGCGLRDEFTAFEVEALKYAVDNNLSVGSNFPFKTEESGFNVLVNDATTIKLLRVSNGKELTAAKVAEGEKVTRPAAAKVVNPVTTPKVENNEAQTLLNQLANIINAPKAAAVDPAEVATLVAAEVAKVRADIEKAHTTKLEINNVEIKAMEGETLHKQFKPVAFAVANGINTYLVGEAGTGKNYLCEQLAKSMGLTFYCVGSLQNKYELEGFVDATGNYQETDFYKAFTNGGVFLFDEIDGTAAEVLIAFNAALANGYYNFPGKGRITAHKDFHALAAGNTVGRGASEAYCGRYQIDASTLDRFCFIHLEYDYNIELKKANNDKDLVDFAHSLRDAVKKQSLTYTVTPRFMTMAAKFVGGGFSTVEALKYALCGSWAAEDIKLLQNNVAGSNKWFKAFAAL